MTSKEQPQLSTTKWQRHQKRSGLRGLGRRLLVSIFVVLCHALWVDGVAVRSFCSLPYNTQALQV